MQIHQQISNLIDNIQKHWERSNSDDDHISRIDRDILISDVRKLYDLIFEMKVGEPAAGIAIPSQSHATAAQSQEKTETGVPEINDEPKPGVSAKQKAEVETKEISDELPPSTQQNPDEVVLEVLNDVLEDQPAEAEQEVAKLEEAEKTEMGDEEKTTFMQVEKTISVRKKEAKISTSEKFAATKTLADIYSKNGDNSLAAKIQKNNISDIKTAIGINDRFLFTNAIFNGDAEAYRNAIEHFNRLETYREALQLFEEIKQKYNLKDEPALGRLIEIVARKF